MPVIYVDSSSTVHRALGRRSPVQAGLGERLLLLVAVDGVGIGKCSEE